MLQGFQSSAVRGGRGFQCVETKGSQKRGPCYPRCKGNYRAPLKGFEVDMKQV